MKIETLKYNYEFKNVFNKGKYYIGNQVIIYFLKNKYDHNRVGIAINKRLCHAFKRNYLKRIIRESYRKLDLNEKNSFDVVFIWNKKCDVNEASYNKVNEDITKIFNKNGLLK